MLLTFCIIFLGLQQFHISFQSSSEFLEVCTLDNIPQKLSTRLRLGTNCYRTCFRVRHLVEILCLYIRHWLLEIVNILLKCIDFFWTRCVHTCSYLPKTRIIFLNNFEQSLNNLWGRSCCYRNFFVCENFNGFLGWCFVS